MEPIPSAADAHPPTEIAHRVARQGVAKAHLDTLTLLVLALIAGAFIALGSAFYLIAVTHTDLGFGPTRVLGGFAFSLGLVLVVVGGAELFTGNNLLAMAWASRLIGTREILRNWVYVYLGNAVGSLGTVALVLAAGTAALGDGAVGETAVQVATAKAGLTWLEAFARGVLCNALVCLAVWLALGGRSVTDKIVAVIMPITAFVALGFEHVVANWFLLPYGMALAGGTIPVGGVAVNLVAVTAGNVVGGTLLVAGVYWVAYLRGGLGASDAAT
jgi:formate/nitrite transporter